MAIAPVVIFYDPKGKVIPGPVKIKQIESIGTITSAKQLEDELLGLSGCYIYEFTHHVYSVSKDYFYALLHGQDFVRKHDPMVFVKGIDQISPYLLKYMKDGSFLSKIEIRWYQYNTKKGKQEEYFRMTLEDVRLYKVRHVMPNVKDPEFEKHGQLEEIQFKFRKINWLYLQGHLSYTDIWNNAFGELYDDAYFESDCDEVTVVAPVVPLELKFISGEFDDSQTSIDFGKRIKVKFSFKSNRKLECAENKVYAKLFCLYNGKTEDLNQIMEGRLVAENSWTTEFKLTTPANFKKGDRVEYYAVIENSSASNTNFKSQSLVLPTGFVHVNLSFYENETFGKDISCTISKKDGKEYKLNTDGKGNVLWKNIPYNDTYTLKVKYRGEIYTELVEWKSTDKELQKIKFKKNNFTIDGDHVGYGTINLHIDYLKEESALVGKNCIIHFYEDTCPQLIAKFKATIKQAGKDSYQFDDISSVDEFEHQLPAPDEADAEGNKYQELHKHRPPHFNLIFDSSKKENFVVIMPFEPEGKIFAVYDIRFMIELEEGAELIFNSKENNPLHHIDCTKILVDNLRDSVIFVIGNHFGNVKARSCGTHYGALYPYTFKDEAEYLAAAERGGFRFTASKFKGTWDQSIKDKFEEQKKSYKLKKTDCITFILEVLELGFAKTHFEKTWKRIRNSLANVTGNEVTIELLKIDWVALFYTPDTNNFYIKDTADILELIYRTALNEKVYGTQILKPIIPLADLIVNYKPTVYYSDRTQVKNPTKPTAIEQEKLSKVMQLPFAFLVAEYGQHTALLIDGSIYGVHWTESPYSDFLFETDERRFTSEKRENCWTWSNGVIVTPKKCWEDQTR